MVKEQHLPEQLRISKSPVLLIFLSVLLLFILLPAAYAAENSSDIIPLDENPAHFELMQSIIDSTSPTDPDALIEARKNEKVIAVSGTIPRYAAGEESYKWFVLLQGVLTKINDEKLLEDYHVDNGGFLIGYGCPRDYLHFYVFSEADVSDEDLNAVIKIIADAAEYYNIAEVPVIIERDAPSQGFNPESSEPSPANISGIGFFGLIFCFGLAGILLMRK